MENVPENLPGGPALFSPPATNHRPAVHPVRGEARECGGKSPHSSERQQLPSALILDAHLKSALAAIRSLGGRGIRVVAAADRITAMGLYSKYSSETFTYPSPLKHRNEFVEAVRRAANNHPTRLVLFTFSDATFVPLYENRDRLGKVFLRSTLRPKPVLRRRSARPRPSSSPPSWVLKLREPAFWRASVSWTAPARLPVSGGHQAPPQRDLARKVRDPKHNPLCVLGGRCQARV